MVKEFGNVLGKVLIDFGKLFPEDRSGLLELAICYYKRRCRGTELSKMIRRMSGAKRFTIYKFFGGTGVY